MPRPAGAGVVGAGGDAAERPVNVVVASSASFGRSAAWRGADGLTLWSRLDRGTLHRPGFGHHLQPGPRLLLLGEPGGTTRRVGQDAGHRLLVGLGRLLMGMARHDAGDRDRVDGLRRLAVRPLGFDFVPEIPVSEAVTDDLQGEEVLALLAQDPAQTLDVVVEELAVSRGRTLGVDQALALEEPDLRDRDVGELLPEEGQDVTDGEIAAAAHSLPATR